MVSGDTAILSVETNLTFDFRPDIREKRRSSRSKKEQAMEEVMSLRGKVIVVTGAAQGIGLNPVFRRSPRPHLARRGGAFALPPLHAGDTAIRAGRDDERRHPRAEGSFWAAVAIGAIVDRAKDMIIRGGEPLN